MLSLKEHGNSPAMQRAFGRIDRECGPIGQNALLKRQCRQAMRLGTGHPAVIARFGARVDLLGARDIATAVIVVERWYRDERKAFQVASATGGGIRLPVIVLEELRLILRWMRRHGAQRNAQVAQPFRSIVNSFSPLVAKEAAE